MSLSRFGHWQKYALIAIVAFVLAKNTIWHLMDGEMLHWDNSIHLSESLDANRTLTESKTSFVELLSFIRWYHPPFVSWSVIPLYRVFGEGQIVASFAITGFL